MGVCGPVEGLLDRSCNGRFLVAKGRHHANQVPMPPRVPRDEKQKTKAVGHLRFALEGDNLALGPWSFSLNALPDTRMSASGLAASLRTMAAMVEVGGLPDGAPTGCGVPGWLQYRKFPLDGDVLIPAPDPVTAEELADSLEEAVREAVLWDSQADVVAFNLIVSLSNQLFGNAMRGDIWAQKALMWAAQNLVNQFTAAALAGAPGIIEEAKMLPWIPGQVSLGPEIGESMKEMCRRVKQGDDFAGPPQTHKTKGKKATLATAQHFLVERLFRYMDACRHNAAILKRRSQEGRIAQLHPLVQLMAQLKPLAADSVRDWIAVAKEVVLDATGGDPLKHPSFRSGGEFESLGNLDRRVNQHCGKASGRHGGIGLGELRSPRAASRQAHNPRF